MFHGYVSLLEGDSPVAKEEFYVNQYFKILFQQVVGSYLYIYIYVGYIERERGYYTTLTFITSSSFHLIFVHHFPWWFSLLAFAWSAPEVAELGLATQVLLLDFSVTTGSSSADIGKARLSGWLFDLVEY